MQDIELYSDQYVAIGVEDEKIDVFYSPMFCVCTRFNITVADVGNGYFRWFAKFAKQHVLPTSRWTVCTAVVAQ